jgi:acetoin utilization protein AcuC
MTETRAATREELQSFTRRNTRPGRGRSRTGEGYLDGGDTPAWRGVYEAAADVVGGTLLAAEQIMAGKVRRAFVPIAGLHHAARGGPRVSACSTTAAWPWKCCGGITA